MPGGGCDVPGERNQKNIMAEITASLVKALRERTGAGMMECKSALVEAKGDLDEGEVVLRKRGIASAGKKASRATKQGLIGTYIHHGGQLRVMEEVNSESDFVARTDIFQELVHDAINYGIGAGAVRNPLAFVQLTPGATMSGWNTINVNGLPAGSFRILFEGQEANNALDGRASDEVQPSVDAVEQFTIQTSNFAAEFGQVAGGLFNFTARSGTNQIHGGAYLYATNEALNAGIPYTSDGQGHHNRPFERRLDGGFSFGAPVYIPKVYNGKNKTFFFFNYEKYRDRSLTNNGLRRVPTDALESGNFSGILTGRNLGTDIAGRAMPENTIYDPATRTTDSSGRYIVQPFAGNIIPSRRFDTVAWTI